MFVSKYGKVYSVFNQFAMKTWSYKQPCRYMCVQALFSLVCVRILLKFPAVRIVSNNRSISLPRSSFYCHVCWVLCDHTWRTFFTRSGWIGLDIPPCFKDLQHLEQEGLVPPNLSSFSKTNCIYGHTSLGFLSGQEFDL